MRFFMRDVIWNFIFNFLLSPFNFQLFTFNSLSIPEATDRETFQLSVAAPVDRPIAIDQSTEPGI